MDDSDIDAIVKICIELSRFYNIRQDELKFIVAKSTLKFQEGMTMQQRCEHLRKSKELDNYPGKISKVLTKIYDTFGIKNRSQIASWR
jgi:hypothetical protein